MGIICGLSLDYIMYYLPPALGDYVDNVEVKFEQKRGKSTNLVGPPPQKFKPLYFLEAPH